MGSSDVRVLLTADVASPESLNLAGYALAEERRKRWITSGIVAQIANVPLSQQILQFWLNSANPQMRIRTPAEINGAPQYNKRCVLVAVERCSEKYPPGIQYFWGLNRKGEWILVKVTFKPEWGVFEIFGVSAVEDDNLDLIKAVVPNSLQVLNGMHTMLWHYQQRMRNILTDIHEEIQKTDYEGSVAEDRADALGWDYKVHGVVK